MGVVERIREIGVLRAIGMSRRQAMRMVVVEAAILGIVGVVLGSVAGLGAGAVAARSSAAGSATAGGIPWPPIGVAAVLGLVPAGARGALPGPDGRPDLDRRARSTSTETRPGRRRGGSSASAAGSRCARLARQALELGEEAPG